VSFLRTIFYNIREARFNPVILTHEILYRETVTYPRMLERLLRRGSGSFCTPVQETYHSKVMRLDDATRLITINRDIELKNLDQFLPYRHAGDLILKNPATWLPTSVRAVVRRRLFANPKPWDTMFQLETLLIHSLPSRALRNR
jgi:hypothetical protein